MNLQALMAQSDIPLSIRGMIDELVEAKRLTREHGNARRFPELDKLIRAELARASELPERRLPDFALASANQIFLDLVVTAQIQA